MKINSHPTIIDLRAGLDGYGEQKNTCPYRDSNTGPSTYIY
jgi:hypothetical protein